MRTTLLWRLFIRDFLWQVWRSLFCLSPTNCFPPRSDWKLVDPKKPPLPKKKFRNEEEELAEEGSSRSLILSFSIIWRYARAWLFSQEMVQEPSSQDGLGSSGGLHPEPWWLRDWVWQRRGADLGWYGLQRRRYEERARSVSWPRCSSSASHTLSFRFEVEGSGNLQQQTRCPCRTETVHSRTRPPQRQGLFALCFPRCPSSELRIDPCSYQDKKRSKEEKEIYNNMRVFARFHTKDEHEEFINGLLSTPFILCTLPSLTSPCTHSSHLFIYNSFRFSCRWAAPAKENRAATAAAATWCANTSRWSAVWAWKEETRGAQRKHWSDTLTVKYPAKETTSTRLSGLSLSSLLLPPLLLLLVRFILSYHSVCVSHRMVGQPSQGKLKLIHLLVLVTLHRPHPHPLHPPHLRSIYHRWTSHRWKAMSFSVLKSDDSAVTFVSFLHIILQSKSVCCGRLSLEACWSLRLRANFSE